MQSRHNANQSMVRTKKGEEEEEEEKKKKKKKKKKRKKRKSGTLLGRPLNSPMCSFHSLVMAD